VLAVYAEDGTLRAVLATYACHCVTLSHNYIGGDWAGYAQEISQRSFPGTVALVSIGCGSDANPDSGVTGDKTDVAAAQGRQIAEEVGRLLKGPMQPITGSIASRLAYVDLPLKELPGREELERLAQENSPAGYNARFQLERLARGEKLIDHVHYCIQSVSFGNSLCMIFLAGEVCVDYALRLRQELDASRLWLHAYSNDFCAYIPSERLLREGGYGGGSEIVYFALPAGFQPGLEQRIIDTVHQITPETFRVSKPQKGTQGVAPKSPQESLKCFHVEDRFEVRLAAAEPLVTDPVAIEFGPDGRLWVVEMPDYGHEVEGEPFTPSGRVKILTDQDKDGQFDKAEVFLEGLRFPTGLTLWRDGLLVCDAPKILWARDRDGDGKAEDVTVLYDGFATHNPHARVNSLRYGVDGWLYGSGGLFGGDITSFSGKRLALQRQDFRIRPDTGDVESATGITQQGRCRDDWDNWFGCDNSTLARHYPLPDHYLRRNPFLIAPETSVFVPADEEAARLYPVGPLVLFKLSGPPGRATSACGVEVYRDDWLGDDLTGNLLTCEPVHQAVHRLVLRADGAIFRGFRAPEEGQREFLASTDQWFRPVQVRTGPDGALWVVDMYRYVIEHKRWIPEEALAELDLMAGRDRGRIYRLVRRDQPARTVPDLTSLAGRSLAELLDHPNGTLRDMVQQRLLWQPSKDCQPVLEEIARRGRYPAARLQALWTLALWKSLPKNLLLAALEDPHDAVRRHAVRIAEQFASDADIAEAIARRATDTAYQVRLQVAFSVGFLDPAKAAPLLAQLAFRHADDPYMLAAVMSSLTVDNSPRVLEAWQANAAEWEGARRRVFLELVAMDVCLRGAPAADKAFTTILGHDPARADEQKFRALARLLESLRRVDRQLDAARNSPVVGSWLAVARDTLRDASAPVGTLRAAAQLLGIWGDQADALLLSELLDIRYPLPVQEAAMNALAQMPHDGTAAMLLRGVTRVSPRLRQPLLDVLLRRVRWTEQLLDAVERGEVTLSLLDTSTRQRLMQHDREAIRRRAANVLGLNNSTRQSVLDAYRTAVTGGGDPQRGRQVFLKHCANCHRFQDQGHAVGPDLSALATKSPQYLLTAVLDPNREVEPRFVAYVALTRDGQTLTGLLVEETTTTITLQEAENKTHKLLRADIEELRATGRSLMPEGLEREITPQQMADLIALLEQFGPPPKTFPGNEPKPVLADDSGVLHLTATHAEIYGKDIRFEDTHRNVGYWHDVRDYVSWQVVVAKDATYELWIEWACADDSAGNELLVEGLAEPISWTVPTTGSWDSYQRRKIGEVRVAAGPKRVLVRPGKGFRGPALLDLRALTLVPTATNE
jgi:putative membrane-bound dehydrogenase-like protein